MVGSGNKLVAVLACFGAFTAALIVVNKAVPYAYMDEIFHVPQTQKYYHGDFLNWDPKITTPPGLYFIGLILSLLLGDSSVETLRWANVIGLPVFSILVARKSRASTSKMLLLMLSPLLSFYVPLYYTDVWASLIVILALVYTLQSQHTISSLLFTISLGFRQTNIIWAAFAGVIALNINHTAFFTTNPKASYISWALNVIKPNGIWTYALPALSFLAFLKLNGAIALGDKSNHQMSVHFCQLLYFALFSAFSSMGRLPQFLVSKYIKRVLCPRSWPLIIVECAVIGLIIWNFSVVHPFVVSDNRHYTFYLWRRLLHPQYLAPYSQLAMVPVYHFSWSFILDGLSWGTVPIAFIGALVLVLVPSPLMEPRYYALPYLVWRLYVSKQPVCALELLVQAATLVSLWAVFCLSSTHFMF